MTSADILDAAPVFYLEDFYVGQRFTSGSHLVDEAQIKRFASEFDPQPFHLDAAAAKDTLFGGLAASGWHTAAITMRLLVQGGLPIAGGIIGLGGELSWSRRVRGMRSRWSARLSKSRLHAHNPIAGLSACAAKRTISMVRWFRPLRRDY
jgi:MaoC like domain